MDYFSLPSAAWEAGRAVLLDGSLVVGFIPLNSDSLFEVDDTGMEGEVDGCLFWIGEPDVGESSLCLEEFLGGAMALFWATWVGLTAPLGTVLLEAARFSDLDWISSAFFSVEEIDVVSLEVLAGIGSINFFSMIQGGL